MVGLALLFDPGRKPLAIDPDVIVVIPEVGCAAQEPIPKGAFGDLQFFGNFVRGILHGQQTRRFDNHCMRNFET